MTSQGSHVVRDSSLRNTYVVTCTNLNFNFKPALYTPVFSDITFNLVQSLSKLILFLYNNSPFFFLNAQYTGATPTFNIEMLCLVTNVKLLKMSSTVK